MRSFFLALCVMLVAVMAAPQVSEATNRFSRFNQIRRPVVVVQPQFNRFSNRGFNNQLRLQNRALQNQLLQQQLLQQQQFQFGVQPFGVQQFNAQPFGRCR